LTPANVRFRGKSGHRLGMVLISDSQIFLDVGELSLTFRTKGNFNLERFRTPKCCLLRWGLLVMERHNGTADHVNGDNLFRR
jgi:hypothetical protein